MTMPSDAQLAALPAEIRSAIDDDELIITAEISHATTYVILTYQQCNITLDPDDVVVFEIHVTSETMNPETRVFTTEYASTKIHESNAYDALCSALQAVAEHHRETYATPAEHDPSLLDRH